MIESRMIYILIVFGLFVISFMPYISAQEHDSEVEIISSSDLRFKQMGESFDDMIFRIRSVFTFDNQAKVELLNDRSLDLKSRQSSWIETKNQVLTQLRSGELVEDDREDLIEEITESHNEIIKKHVELVQQLNDIKIEAQAEGETSLSENADSKLSEINNLGLALGLSEDEKNSLASELESEVTVNEPITEDDSLDIAQDNLNFNAENVQRTNLDGRDVFIVTGSESETSGDTTIDRNYEVTIDVATGLILSANLVTPSETESGSIIESNEEDDTDINIDIGTNVEVGSQASIDGEGSVSESSGVSIGGNVLLNSDVQDNIQQLIDSANNMKINIIVTKENGNVVIDKNIEGELTSEQENLLVNIEEELRTIVNESSRNDARITIEINHKRSESIPEEEEDDEIVINTNIGNY